MAFSQTAPSSFALLYSVTLHEVTLTVEEGTQYQTVNCVIHSPFLTFSKCNMVDQNRTWDSPQYSMHSMQVWKWRWSGWSEGVVTGKILNISPVIDWTPAYSWCLLPFSQCMPGQAPANNMLLNMKKRHNRWIKIIIIIIIPSPSLCLA